MTLTSTATTKELEQEVAFLQTLLRLRYSKDEDLKAEAEAINESFVGRHAVQEWAEAHSSANPLEELRLFYEAGMLDDDVWRLANFTLL